MDQDGNQEDAFQISGQALWQWRQWAQQVAIAASVPSSELDWFLLALTGLDRLTLRLGAGKAGGSRQFDQAKRASLVSLKRPLTELTALWQQRVQQQVPVQYLVGETPWRQFQLTVSPAVLIPRPETEELIEVAIARVGHTDLALGHWADLGTGSGAIALGLAAAFPQATVHAVDISADALAIAHHNAERYQMAGRIQFYQGSWFNPLEPLQHQLSAVVSNPPYIPTATLAQLQPEVAHHEPHLALDGGSDGLNSLRHLVATAPNYLKPGGLWLVELMQGQAADVVALLRQQNFCEPQVHRDLAGIERFVSAMCAPEAAFSGSLR
ncbi:MAG: peptide chain release factor N(5)-glutamine methyltransferase [Kaiparowitsia implicata GSE-PSE-MK54-09C]|jgi:release factor glutamine methyltransferase|nr:peptide chain release factor N(5)-glutamine methyltransferase [Kaiparowitsia implicata GSE-PSE-MK54-09C]